MKEIDTDGVAGRHPHGAGETFCAGDDLKGFATFGQRWSWEIRMYQQTAKPHRHLVPVTIAAVRRCSAPEGGLSSPWCATSLSPPTGHGWVCLKSTGHHPGGVARAVVKVRRARRPRMEPDRRPLRCAHRQRHALATASSPRAIDAEVAELADAIWPRTQNHHHHQVLPRQGADLDMYSSMFFEGAPQRGPTQQASSLRRPGTTPPSATSRDFWQDGETVADGSPCPVNDWATNARPSTI